MSTSFIRIANHYVADHEENGLAADNERMSNASFDTNFFGKNEKITMQPGLYVLRSAPAVGKTAFLLQMCNDFAKNTEKRIIYYTFKESTRELITRSFACVPAVSKPSGQNFVKISAYENSVQLMDIAQSAFSVRLTDKAQLIFYEYGYRIYFAECSAKMTVHDIKASIENNAICNIVFIDGLQDLTLTESLDYALRELKTFQKEHNLVIIASFSTAYADDADKRAVMNYADVVWDLEADESDDDSNKTNVRLTWTKNRFNFASDTVYSYYPECNIFL